MFLALAGCQVSLPGAIMLQFGNFKFEKEFEADGFTKLLCHFNWLQGWPSWDLDAKDSSFHGIASTVYGAVQANPSYEGVFNGCAYFPTGNSNDYILYSDNLALQIPTNLTLECFVSPSKLSGNRMIVEKPNSYRIYFTDGTPNVTLNFTIYIGFVVKNLAITIPENSFYLYWSHLKATYDGQYQRLYVNGVEKGNRAQTGLIDITNDPLVVGKNTAGNNWPYKGFIDELRISNIVRPFIGTKVFAGKTAQTGTKVQGLSGGQSTLKRQLISGQSGQSRLNKQIPEFLDGNSFLAYLNFQSTSGRSALSKVRGQSVSGSSKLAYFAFEANLSQIVMDSLKIVRTPLGELTNKGHFLYRRDYRGRSFSGVVEQNDLESQGRYGVWEKSFELNFVRDTAMAVEVANYYLNASKNIRLRILFRTFLGGLHLEVGDHILVNYPLPGLAGQFFTVTDLRFLPGSGYKRQMDLVEVKAIGG